MCESMLASEASSLVRHMVGQMTYKFDITYKVQYFKRILAEEVALELYA